MYNEKQILNLIKEFHTSIVFHFLSVHQIALATRHTRVNYKFVKQMFTTRCNNYFL